MTQQQAWQVYLRAAYAATQEQGYQHGAWHDAGYRAVQRDCPEHLAYVVDRQANASVANGEASPKCR